MNNEKYTKSEAYALLSDTVKNRKNTDIKSLILFGSLIIFIALCAYVFRSVTLIKTVSNSALCFFLILFFAFYVILSCISVTYVTLSLISDKKSKKLKKLFDSDTSSVINPDLIPDSYEEFVSRSTDIGENEFIKDCLNQAFINSHITKLKNKKFKIAMITACALIIDTLVLTILLYVV